MCKILPLASSRGGGKWGPGNLPAIIHLFKASSHLYCWLRKAHACLTLQSDHTSHPGWLLPLIRSVFWYKVLQTIPELINEVTLRQGPWCCSPAWAALPTAQYSKKLSLLQSSVIDSQSEYFTRKSLPTYSSQEAKVCSSLGRTWFI